MSLPTLHDVELTEVERALALLTMPGATFEIRALGEERGYPVTWSGYFRDPSTAAKAISSIERNAKGIYVTLNPVKPELFAKCANRLGRPGKGGTTGDQHIVRRTRLLIDIDAERPAGISATDSERDAALAIADEIHDERTSAGWPEPLRGDSGNGGHLVWGIDLPTEDNHLIERVLAKMAATWNCEVNGHRIKVDTSVANPARISKVYGTVSRKGDSVDGREHRTARILAAPNELVAVTREQLEEFVGPIVKVEAHKTQTACAENKQRPGDPLPTLDVPAWLAKYGIAVKGTKPNRDGGIVYELEVCPNNSEHNRGEAFVIQLGSGAISAGCQHESCQWNWAWLREKLDGPRPTQIDRTWTPISLDETHPFAPNGDRLPHGLTVIDGGQSSQPDTPAPVGVALKGQRWSAIVDELYRRATDPWISLRIGATEIANVRIGSYVVLIGPEGSGKSSLVLQMLSEFERDVGHAIYVTPELDADEAGGRMIGQDRDATWRDVLLGQVPREEVIDRPRFVALERDNATLKNLEAEVLAIREQDPHGLILVGWDYLQASPGGSDGERGRIAKISIELRKAAKRLGIVIVALSQSSRAGAKQLDSGELLGSEAGRSGAESSQIERDAYVIITVGDRQIREDGTETRSVSIGKYRMGGGDIVYSAVYAGRTGRWTIEDTSRPAAEVREERVGREESTRITAAELAMVQAAQVATSPLTRDQLREISATKRAYGQRAIANLIARGDLVEVDKRQPRSRSYMLSTPTRAAELGVSLLTNFEDA